MTDSASSTPSTLAIFISTAILGIVAGYFIGTAKALGLTAITGGTKSSWPNSYDVTIHPDSSDEELMRSLKGGASARGDEDEDEDEEEDEEDSGDEAKGELASFEGNKEECKLVLVVRTDLGMGKGKIAAQCSHATLACYTQFLTRAPKSPILRRWQSLGQAKIAVQCGSEDELLTLQAQALSVGLCARVIRDAGRTQIASGSATVLGVGPGPRSIVDGVTGRLKLL